MIVFIRGSSKGLNNLIDFGGQIPPKSILGDRILWKWVQNSDTKNIISDKINNIIDNLVDDLHFFVCIPWKVLSRITSRHHNIIVIDVKMIIKIK